MLRKLFMLPLLLIMGTLLACGSASTSSTDTVTDDGGDDTNTGATASNSLAVTYPDDLAITSLTAASSSAAANLSALRSRFVVADDVLEPQSFDEKKDEIAGILTATDPADVQVDINFQQVAADVGCYGPIVFLNQGGGIGHPDGAIQAQTGQGSQSLPPFDMGIWEESESTGEACIAAQMNKLMADIENYVNLGLKGSAAVLAAANLSDATIPDMGDSEDLTATADAVFTENDAPIDPTSVVMSRDAEDTSEGFPVFTLEMAADIVDSTPPALKKVVDDSLIPTSMEITMTHIPEVELADGAAVPEDSTYCGRIQQKVNFESAQQFGMNFDGCTGATECISISYCKDSETSLSYHMLRGQFCGTDADCFNADGDVNVTEKKLPQTDSGWASNFFNVTCQVDPTDGSGSCAQAWQAGSGDSATRTFNVTVNADGTGCGYYGFGPEISSEEGVGQIDKMICNWVGPGGAINTQNYTGQPLAQRQCFARNTDGLFESISDDTDNDGIDESLAITYAPTNSCNKAANSFAYGQADTPPDMDVDAADVINNDLIDVGDVIFTMPTAPVVP